MKLIAAIVIAVLTSLAFAQDFAPGLVFQRDRIIPVVAAELWSDEGLTFFGGKPSVDALLGYDTSTERMQIGYQAVLNWRITDNTSLYFGGAYLGNIGETRWADLWDRLGIAAGAKLRF